jgi:hypothetical protein
MTHVLPRVHRKTPQKAIKNRSNLLKSTMEAESGRDCIQGSRANSCFAATRCAASGSADFQRCAILRGDGKSPRRPISITVDKLAENVLTGRGRLLRIPDYSRERNSAASASAWSICAASCASRAARAPVRYRGEVERVGRGARAYRGHLAGRPGDCRQGAAQVNPPRWCGRRPAALAAAL